MEITKDNKVENAGHKDTLIYVHCLKKIDSEIDECLKSINAQSAVVKEQQAFNAAVEHTTNQLVMLASLIQTKNLINQIKNSKK